LQQIDPPGSCQLSQNTPAVNVILQPVLPDLGAK
jgi:hypothetical protein